ncbi:MAG: hypothetical protein ACRDF9_06070 [Candidatus Limnocylindria bacterium]
MRFWLAVLAAAVADLAAFLAVPNWIGVAAIGAIGYLLFSAFGAGWFAMRRSALAGFLSVIVGALIYGAYSLWRQGADGGAGAADLLGWEARLLLAVLPFAVGGAFTGAAGGWLRRRAMGRV